MQIGSSILSMLKERIFGPRPPASSPLSLSGAFSPSIHSFIHIPKEMVSPFGELIRFAIQPTPSERARTPRRLAPSISNKARRGRERESEQTAPMGAVLLCFVPMLKIYLSLCRVHGRYRCVHCPNASCSLHILAY